MRLSEKVNWTTTSTVFGSVVVGALLVIVAGYFALDPLIRGYILDNPEVIIESVQQYEIDQHKEFAQRAIALNYSAIYENETSQIGGNPEGDVTLVEFFDYQCGFCKRTLPDMVALIEDENLKIIYKEYPILGPESVVAARAALASSEQGKYLDYHHALMAFEGTLTDEAIMDIAGTVGLDRDQLAEDMQNPRIMLTIGENLLLADNLEVTGTPTFVLNDEIIIGAVGLEDLRSRIADARDEIGD